MSDVPTLTPEEQTALQDTVKNFRQIMAEVEAWRDTHESGDTLRLNWDQVSWILVGLQMMWSEIQGLREQVDVKVKEKMQ